MKKSASYFTLGLLAGCVIAAFAFACISRKAVCDGASSGIPVRVIKFAHGLPKNHPVHDGIVRMAERISELSGGSMRLEIYPSEQMGDETRCVEQAQLGTLEMTKVSAAPLGGFISACKVFCLPYLFRDSEHYWTVLDGSVGEKMLDAVSVRDDGRPSGLVGIGFFDAGSRNFYTVRPVHSMKDLKGMKIRVMRDPVAMDMIAALGASPVAIPWGELYCALQQGVVDGAENNPPSIVSARHGEVCKYLLMDGHSRIPDMVVASAKFWNSLTPIQQGWIREAMQEASRYQRELWRKSTEASLEELKSEGVEVSEADKDEFRAATESVIGKYSGGVVGEMYREIQEVK